MCSKLNKSPFPQVVDQCNEYADILKVRKKGRDKSIDWFSNKFNLPHTPNPLKAVNDALNHQNGMVLGLLNFMWFRR